MKVFIDIFIGIWAFILGYIWTNHINVTRRQGEACARSGSVSRSSFSASWRRSLIGLYLALGTPAAIAAKVLAAMGQANAFRVIFFILTFFSIGVLSNFRTLWQEGIGRLAARVCRQPVRLRDLGRAADFLAVLQRRPSAAGKLKGRVMSQPNVGEELRKAAVEPLLPIEKKLIGWSLGTGIALLGHPRHRQPLVPGHAVCRPEAFANPENRAVRRRGDRPAQPRGRAGQCGAARLAGGIPRRLDAGQRAAWRQPAAPARPAEPITIVYASESGNCEKLAGDFAKAARKNGLKPTLIDMADLELAELTKAKRLIFIAATWGEGDPPARAVRAYGELMGEGAPRLDGVEFGVLALGDTAYAEFCAIGKKIDERLAALGRQARGRARRLRSRFRRACGRAGSATR